jgi:pimeloyl-ACP methyl ester carboxylesterase
LHGLVCRPSNSEGTWVIHVHGSYGNFYENFFLTPMANAFTEAGICFVSINTRGHDYYADLKSREDGRYASRRVGGIRDDFFACSYDVRPWIAYARRRGAESVMLQGHSLGAMKVAYTAWKTADPLAGVILLSPPDNLGLQRADVGERYDDYLELARKLAAESPDAPMPKQAYFDPISAGAYRSLFERPEETGMFTYGDVELMSRSALPRINAPIIATFATDDEAVVDDISTCVRALRESVPPERLTVEIIEGANHNYHFKEIELASILATWASSPARSKAPGVPA